LHDTLADARACRRCPPAGLSEAEVNIARVEAACRAIARAEWPPRLAALAAAAELSPGHFHRLFKTVTGVTPRAYAAARRAEAARAALTESSTVTEAIHAAGLGASRFYGDASAMLGMTPARYRGGGARERLRFAVGRCALGEVLVASSDAGVAAILLGDDPDALARDLQDRFPRAELVGGDPAYEAVVAQAVGLVDRGEPLDLPLDVRGTLFQRRVWAALRGLAAGETLSYAELAARIGAPAAVRAVAGACAANAHAVAIPCHRVVRRDGGLSGYRWGVERKRELRAREAESRG
jgi:AraC family transcriptional regulator of adaptative response/methylated-DNA-[protein]-cysteine methyltransferase